jgi:hypothetical protein
MFRPWHCTLQVTPTAALLTPLERPSLWRGKPLHFALSVADECLTGRSSMPFGDELWPSESQLVQFNIVHHVHPKRLGCVGDLRLVRKRAKEVSP